MARAVLFRLAQLPVILLAVSAVIFFTLRLAPGDPVEVAVATVGDPEISARIRREWGLDRPVPEQYLLYLARTARADFGRSFFSNAPVMDTLRDRFPATLELAIASMLVALLLGLSMGVVSAVRRNSALDAFNRSVALVGMSLPVFWLGLMLIALFAVVLDWLPVGGRFNARVPLQPITGVILLDFVLQGDLAGFRIALSHLALPSLALGIGLAGFIARLTRTTVLEAFRQDYIRTARAKGVHERMVILRHALRNALLPIVTILGLQFGSLLGGAAVTETVFSWPGLGKLLVDSIYIRDYPQVQASVLLLALSYVLTNMAVDILYTCIDPRTRR